MNLLTAGMIGSGVIRTTGQAWSDATADGKLTVVEGFGLIKSGLSATPYLNKTILHFDTAHGRLGYVRTEAIAVGNALTPLLGLVPGVNYHEAMQAAYGITAAMSSALYDALKDGILTLGELLDSSHPARGRGGGSGRCRRRWLLYAHSRGGHVRCQNAGSSC